MRLLLVPWTLLRTPQMFAVLVKRCWLTTMQTGDRPAAGKIDPEALALRAPPRRVVRFKRRLMIGIATAGIAGIFGVTWLALKGPILRFGQPAQEVYSTDQKSAPDGLTGTSSRSASSSADAIPEPTCGGRSTTT